MRPTAFHGTAGRVHIGGDFQDPTGPCGNASVFIEESLLPKGSSLESGCPRELAREAPCPCADASEGRSCSCTPAPFAPASSGLGGTFALALTWLYGELSRRVCVIDAHGTRMVSVLVHAIPKWPM